ncbi:MAG: hypothetical protein KH304_15930 [Clostridium sp.]|nr:hypothetical protein [Clostridium sp.]
MQELKKEEIKQVIEGRGYAGRTPMLYDMWIYPWIYGERREAFEVFMDEQIKDVDFIDLVMPENFQAPEDAPDYKWAYRGLSEKMGVGIDAKCIAEEWEDMDSVYRSFPTTEYPGLIPQKKLNKEKYIVARWIFCFFERMWSFRGMENALTDFYLYPEEVHCLFRRLADYYMRIMERVKEETGADAIFVTDDIGTQSGPFFSLDIFREFFKPYYKQLIDKAHSLGMHFWLHTCGNIELYMEDFIEIGLDVIHPIQKYTMDYQEIAKKYGDRICLLVGFDVQQTIPFGTPGEVRQEVRDLIDTFSRPSGRFMLTMGNGSTLDWQLSSLEALYSETETYIKTWED